MVSCQWSVCNYQDLWHVAAKRRSIMRRRRFLANAGYGVAALTGRSAERRAARMRAVEFLRESSPPTL